MKFSQLIKIAPFKPNIKQMRPKHWKLNTWQINLQNKLFEKLKITFLFGKEVVNGIHKRDNNGLSFLATIY